VKILHPNATQLTVPQRPTHILRYRLKLHNVAQRKRGSGAPQANRNKLYFYVRRKDGGQSDQPPAMT